MPTERDALLSVQSSSDAKPPFLAPFLWSLVAALGPLSFGYTLGYTSPVGDELKSPPDGIWILSNDQNALFGSLVNVGAMTGALLGGFILDGIGRRRTMFVSSLPFVGGWLMMSFAKSFIVILIGRILTGVGVGLVSLTVPVYISEISPSHLRGGMGSINQLAVTLGILLVYAVGLASSYRDSDGNEEVPWRELAWIGAIFPGALGVLSFFMPASPRWLVRKGYSQDAQQSLQRLRGHEFDVIGELTEIEDAIKKEAEESLEGGLGTKIASLLKLGKKPLIIVVCLMLFQQFSGINSVIFYAKPIFDDAGFHNANTSSLIVAVVQVVVTAISCVIIDKAGRRSLLMSAGIGMVAAAAVLGYFFYMQNNNTPVDGIVALVSTLLYIACFSLGLGAIPWLMMSELFPAKIRGAASSFATLLNWSCSFLVTETFDKMKSGMTEEGVFWFYGSVCLVGTAYVLLAVPETKGRSLEEIEAYFAGVKGAGNQDKDGAGKGGALVKIASVIALIYIGATVLATSF